MKWLHSIPQERPRRLPQLSTGVLRTLEYWLGHGNAEFLTLHILPNSARVYLPDGRNARQLISTREFNRWSDPYIYQPWVTETTDFKKKVKVVWRNK